MPVQGYRYKWLPLVGAAIALFLMACSTPSIKPVTTFKAAGYENTSFKDTLVIAVAGDYEARAHFERVIASQLNAAGVTGTAYYAVVGRNKAITRSDVSDAVRARGFDSVILTRIVSRESVVTEETGASTAKVTRRDADTPIDLFRYDYEVLNNPAEINIASTVVLATEVFSAAEEMRIFAMEETISGKQDVRLLVEEAAEKIVAHLRKEGIIGR